MARGRTDWALWGIGGTLALGLLLAPLWLNADKPSPPLSQAPPPLPTPPAPRPNGGLEEFATPDGETLLRLIVAEQEKNLAKIRSIKFAYTKFRKVMTPGDEHEATTEHRIVRSGKSVWCERKFRSHFFNSKKGQSHTDYIVWNDKALMFWPSVGLNAYLWEYTSIDAMPEEARSYMKMAFAFPELRYACGYGPHSLREMLDDPDKQELRYQVTKDVDGEVPVYTVVVLPPERVSSHPIMRLTVDPARGYMVTHRVDYLDGIVPASECRLVPREIASGIWMPESWEQRVYAKPKSRDNRPITLILFQDKVEVEEVNSSVPERQFTWRSVGLKPSTQIRRVDVSGEVCSMHVVNGELVEKVEPERRAVED